MDLDLFARAAEVPFARAEETLDLACGTGRTGEWLRGNVRGAIDGVDMTPEMLARARARGIYRELLLGDIRDTKLPAARYDLVTQSLACEHLGDLAPLYREAARVVRPEGHFVIVGFHPFFMMSGVPTHFDRASGEPVAIATHVHLLSDHHAAGRAAGFTLVRLDERLIDRAWLEKRPRMAKYANLPISFLAAFRREN
jgi:SAM-dependent methyltransferase